MKSHKRTLAAPALAALVLVALTGTANAGNGSGMELGAAVEGPNSCTTPVAASVDVDVAVTAGSAAPVTFSVSIAGGPFTDAGTSNNWTSYGKTKALEETIRLSVAANGLGSQVWICAAQPGANGKGNDTRSACVVVVPGVLCDGTSGTGLI